MKRSGRKDEPRESMEKWLQTPEDWAPSFPEAKHLSPEEWRAKYPRTPRDRGGFLLARFSQLSNGQWRVSVWGADDMGMERDQPSRMEALELFKRLPNPVTRDALEKLGFVPA